MDKVLAFSKKLLKEVIDKNSIVVDATAGNGNDTLFLAKTSAKKVFAFDVQNQATTNTNDLLEKNNLADKSPKRTEPTGSKRDRSISISIY